MESEGYKKSQLGEEAAAETTPQRAGATCSDMSKDVKKLWKHGIKVYDAIYHGNVNFQNFQIRLVICLEGGTGNCLEGVFAYRTSMVFLLRLYY